MNMKVVIKNSENGSSIYLDLNKLIVESSLVSWVAESKASVMDHEKMSQYGVGSDESQSSFGARVNAEEVEYAGLDLNVETPGTRELLLTGPRSALLLQFNPMSYKYR